MNEFELEADLEWRFHRARDQYISIKRYFDRVMPMLKNFRTPSMRVAADYYLERRFREPLCAARAEMLELSQKLDEFRRRRQKGESHATAVAEANEAARKKEELQRRWPSGYTLAPDRHEEPSPQSSVSPLRTTEPVSSSVPAPVPAVGYSCVSVPVSTSISASVSAPLSASASAPVSAPVPVHADAALRSVETQNRHADILSVLFEDAASANEQNEDGVLVPDSSTAEPSSGRPARRLAQPITDLQALADSWREYVASLGVFPSRYQEDSQPTRVTDRNRQESLDVDKNGHPDRDKRLGAPRQGEDRDRAVAQIGVHHATAKPPGLMQRLFGALTASRTQPRPSGALVSEPRWHLGTLNCKLDG